LLMQLKTMTDQEFIEKYNFIIIDESHRRNTDLELLILLLKKIYERNAVNIALPFLVFMSATFNPKEFVDYFGLDETYNSIYVAGLSTFPKKIIYTNKFNTSTFSEEAALKAIEIHKDNPNDKDTSADILIFVPGDSNMIEIADYLKEERNKLEKANKPSFIIIDIRRKDIDENSYKSLALNLPISEIDMKKLDRIEERNNDERKKKDREFKSKEKKVDNMKRNKWKKGGDEMELDEVELDDDIDELLEQNLDEINNFEFNEDTDEQLEQNFNEINGGSSSSNYIRKIIIATEIIETGITIDTLRYVIDTGYFKEMSYNPIYGITGLVMKPIPQSSAKQRIGRVGRVAEGFAHLLYSEEVFNKLIIDKFPEILTSDISSSIMLIVSAVVGNEPDKLDVLPSNGFNPNEIDMLQPIPIDMLKNIMEKCIKLGFLSGIKSKEILGGAAIMETERPKYELYLTSLGKVACRIDISINSTKMILSGLAWNVSLLDLIAIASYLEIDKRSLFDNKLPIKWNDIVKKSKVLSWLVDDGEILRERMLLGSDFIRGIFLTEMVLETMNKENALDGYKELEKFALKCNLKFDGLLSMMIKREEIINSFIMTGVNINYGERLKNVLPEEFLNTITSIKYCIIEGYKLNKATYDEKITKYRIEMGNLEVELPNLFTLDERFEAEKKYGLSWKNVPRIILYDKIVLRGRPDASNIYKLEFNNIEMLDGY